MPDPYSHASLERRVEDLEREMTAAIKLIEVLAERLVTQLKLLQDLERRHGNLYETTHRHILSKP